MNGVPYTKEQLEFLRRRYARSPMNYLLKVLHPHTEESIHRKANQVGLRRRRTPLPRHKVLLQLRQAREAAGLTRKELAKIMGYHVVMIGRWERGDQFPNLFKLHAWADALSMKIVAQPIQVQKRSDCKSDFSMNGHVADEVLQHL